MLVVPRIGEEEEEEREVVAAAAAAVAAVVTTGMQQHEMTIPHPRNFSAVQMLSSPFTCQGVVVRVCIVRL